MELKQPEQPVQIILILNSNSMEIEVKGHSGCSIDIVTENSELYIIKGSENKDYINRLYQQTEKQKQAEKQEYRHIRIPHIYAIKKDNHSIKVKMEYIYSKNFIAYFETSGFEKMEYFITSITTFIEEEIARSKLSTIDTTIVQKKFEDIYKKIKENKFTGKDIEIDSLMKQSKVSFNLLPTQIEIPIGTCHGDLTFSNILFNDTNYYLIDFLDSFIESPLIDMVKIRQDTCYLWSTLMYAGTYDKLRMMILAEKIDTNLNEIFSRYKWYRDYYHTFQIMNFLRIMQYAHEQPIINYLKKVISNLVKI